MKNELKIDMKIIAKVIDGKTGKVKMKRKIKCHTFLKNFSALALLMFMKGDSIISSTIINQGGTSKTVRASTTTYTVADFLIASSFKTRCRIGTNTTAFDRDQYDVLTYLAELLYSEYNLSDTGSQKELRITFSWTNDTGVSKDVAEACLGITVLDDASNNQDVNITRDVFDPAITVPNGDVLAMGYVITIPW